MNVKKILVLLLTVTLICSILSSVAFAQYQDCKDSNTTFTDLKPEHWAYDAVMRMVNRKIISGYSDCTFKPAKNVTRAEFAKIMVLALNLELSKPKSATFLDIEKKDWSYPYVESAKYYLTSFRTSNGDYFKPSSSAVREDMAVAMVKALGYENEEANLSKLDIFNDKNNISPNLRKHIALAVEHRVMQGYPIANSNYKAFKPQAPLTRAQAAVLLSRFVKEEKVTYDEEKVTYDDSSNEKESDDGNDSDTKENTSNQYTSPKVSAKTHDGKVILSWTRANGDNFKYYKIVISKYNANPKYPQDGYLYYITDRSNLTAVIDNSRAYKNGDFGKYLVPGEKYYFSVTTVYKHKKLYGNSVLLKYPWK